MSSILISTFRYFCETCGYETLSCSVEVKLKCLCNLLVEHEEIEEAIDETY
ncbi:hypothetical protein [Priestia megaterium]|uniref:hypothetical protein n=1 Tax=Priestia megaterium TaxID=1404 RepID=UPI003CC67E97